MRDADRHVQLHGVGWTTTASSTLAITIFGTNDAPVANPDTNWVLDVTSGADPTSSGNVLQDVAHPGIRLRR
jgi:hypothetical protein